VSTSERDHALEIANNSYDWYRQAAIKARRYYRISELVQILISTAIPVSAVLDSSNVKLPAILGALIMALTGLRSVFHWHDDYLRFSSAREAVEAERRLYITGGDPYADPDSRARILAAKVTQIERGEMENWIQLASQGAGRSERGT
jgi:hypothetical protein